MKAIFIRWLPWLPVVLLILLALNQLRLVHTRDLSQWLGAGFGMFSTADSVASRYLHLYGITSTGARWNLPLPDELEELAERVRGLPDDQWMREIGTKLDTHLATNDCPDNPQRCTYAKYQIEVWRTLYDPETLQPQLEQIGGVEFEPE